MCGSCIATFTAFIVTNDRVIFGPQGGGVTPWVLPGAILGPAIFVWLGYYAIRFQEDKKERYIIGTRESGRAADEGAHGLVAPPRLEVVGDE